MSWGTSALQCQGSEQLRGFWPCEVMALNYTRLNSVKEQLGTFGAGGSRQSGEWSTRLLLMGDHNCCVHHCRVLPGLAVGVKGTSKTHLGMTGAALVPCSPSCQVRSVAVEQGWHSLLPHHWSWEG